MSIKWGIAIVVVVLLLGGSATAALKISGKDVTDSSLTGKDVRDSSLTGADIRDRSLAARDFSEPIRGPEGPQGAPGVQGPAGPSGLTLIQQRPTSVPLGASSAVVASSECAAGEQAVSGGYLPDNGAIYIISSLAGTGSKDGWSVLAVNPDTAAHSITVIAYCAPLPPGATARATATSRSGQPDRQQLEDLAASTSSQMLHLKEPHRP